MTLLHPTRPSLLGLLLTATVTAGTGAAQATDTPTPDQAFAAAAADRGTAPTVDGLPALVLDAHRGGGLEARENSISGIKHALASGVVDVVDLDVRRLSDGTLGVMHDPTVDRVTTSTGPTSSFDRAGWTALTLDIGSWLDPVPAPEAPPTLGQVLDRFGGKTVFTVEVKEGLLDEVEALLRDRHLTGSVLVNTNRPRVARAIHDAGLHAHLWRSSRQMRHDHPGRWASWLDVVDIDVRGRDSDITRFVDSGIPRVWAHTISTRAERNRAVRLGAGGVVTDDPRYLSGKLRRYPASPTVVKLLDEPEAVQVSDATSVRVEVGSESGPVVPEAAVRVTAAGLTGRTVDHPSPGTSEVQLSAAGAEKGRERVRFTVPAGKAGERRWPSGAASTHVRVRSEDLALVPTVVTSGRRLRVSVRLLDSAATSYEGDRAERGRGRTVADLAAARLKVRVVRHGEVVHAERRDGVDTGSTGDGAGTVRFTAWKAPVRGRYTVRVGQTGPVYRHVVVAHRVTVG